MNHPLERALTDMFDWRMDFSKTYRTFNEAIKQFNAKFKTNLAPLSLLLKPVITDDAVEERLLMGFRFMEKAHQQLVQDTARLEKELAQDLSKPTHSLLFINPQKEAQQLLNTFSIRCKKLREEIVTWENRQFMIDILLAQPSPASASAQPATALRKQ